MIPDGLGCIRPPTAPPRLQAVQEVGRDEDRLQRELQSALEGVLAPCGIRHEAHEPLHLTGGRRSSPGATGERLEDRRRAARDRVPGPRVEPHHPELTGRGFDGINWPDHLEPVDDQVAVPVPGIGGVRAVVVVCESDAEGLAPALEFQPHLVCLPLAALALDLDGLGGPPPHAERHARQLLARLIGAGAGAQQVHAIPGEVDRREQVPRRVEVVGIGAPPAIAPHRRLERLGLEVSRLRVFGVLQADRARRDLLSGGRVLLEE